MDEEDSMEIDPAMAAAMGFSSFGTKPGAKRKHNSSDGFVDPSISSQSQAPKKGASNTNKAAKLPKDTAVVSDNNPGSSVAAAKTPSEASLEELRNGVRNEKGDMVYFLPSFLEDPWKDLKPK